MGIKMVRADNPQLPNIAQKSNLGIQSSPHRMPFGCSMAGGTEVNTSSQRENHVYYFELKPDQANKALLKVTATPNSKQIRPTYA